MGRPVMSYTLQGPRSTAVAAALTVVLVSPVLHIAEITGATIRKVIPAKKPRLSWWVLPE